METKIFSKKELQEAAKFLRENKLVAFPTETVYGLGANALNKESIKKIYKAKGRPSDNPLIAHIADFEDIHKLTEEIPGKAKKLIEKFWPGPLTIVLKKKESVPDELTAGSKFVAIRMPSNQIAREIIRLAKTPVAAPSANLSTKPSPTKVEHVIDDLTGRIEGIVDGGEVEVGIESTVIDLTSDVPTILRPGKISKEQMEEIIGRVETKTKSGAVAKSPGMKYKHYSPEAKVVLTNKENFQKLKEKYGGKKIGEIKLTCTLEYYAKIIFSEFRRMDKEGMEIILVESVPEIGLGTGIMNRLKKAASEIIIN